MKGARETKSDRDKIKRVKVLDGTIRERPRSTHACLLSITSNVMSFKKENKHKTDMFKNAPLNAQKKKKKNLSNE